jgi:PPOX class probable F420-dependent enzyme
MNQQFDFSPRIQERLENEPVIWLVTVRSDGTPMPFPVWFLWTGSSFLIFSQPDALKLIHIANHPRVALHFDSDGRGGDIVVFRGEARIDRDGASQVELRTYLDKYPSGLRSIGMTEAEFTQSYSVPIRVKIDPP